MGKIRLVCTVAENGTGEESTGSTGSESGYDRAITPLRTAIDTKGAHNCFGEFSRDFPEANYRLAPN